MSARRLLPLVLLAGFIPVADVLFATPQARKGRKVAFLVGVGTFRHNLRNLGDSPRKDVDALETELKANGFEVVKLTEQQATKEAVEARFRKVLEGDGDSDKSLGKDDVLLVALCSHGFTFEAGFGAGRKQEPYIAGHDAVPGESSRMISLNGLIETAKPFGATKLFLVDACREEFDPNRGTRGIEGTQMALPKRTAVLFACGQGQMSHQSEKANGHGLFTYAVLKTFRAGGRITWTRLVGGVEEAFDTDEIKAMLPTGKSQVPVEAKGEMGTTELFGKAAAVPPVGGGSDPKGTEERTVEIADGVRVAFCWIPPGKATLGSPAGEDGRTDAEEERPFETKGFWLGKFEVTQGEWTQVTKGPNPSLFASTGDDEKYTSRVKGLDTTRFPVERVSWEECTNFVDRLNSRAAARTAFGRAGKFALPTEDEWEYAARGGKGNKQPFYWGNELNGTQANCNGGTPHGTAVAGPNLDRTCSVDYTGDGKYPAHPWGLRHMHGNVWEWCASDDRKVSGNKVNRGGSWLNSCVRCRAAYPENGSTTWKYYDIGLRLAYRFD